MNEQRGDRSLWYLKQTADVSWEPHVFLQTPSSERTGKLSPDGRYVAHMSTRKSNLIKKFRN